MISRSVRLRAPVVRELSSEAINDGLSDNRRRNEKAAEVAAFFVELSLVGRVAIFWLVRAGAAGSAAAACAGGVRSGGACVCGGETAVAGACVVAAAGIAACASKGEPGMRGGWRWHRARGRREIAGRSRRWARA